MPGPICQSLVQNDRGLTMNATKAFMIAGLAALSLGIGSAMAQTETTATSSDSWTGNATAPTSVTVVHVQSGSPDPDRVGFEATGAPPFHGDYSTLANSG
jgi:hypothetical protein